MSTHLPGQATSEQLEPVVFEDLVEYFRRGAKPTSQWRVGAEFEKFALNRQTGKAVPYHGPNGIRSILEKLVERFHWEPHFYGEQLITLTREGSAISLEPGSQVEFSTPPVQTLQELETHLKQHREELRAVVDPEEIVWVSAGVTPFTTVEDFPKPLRQRHCLMAESMPKRGPMSLHMMYATASTQATFDYQDEADAMRKFHTALRLAPIVNALWGNSPFYAGKPMGWDSYRGMIWLEMDPERCGMLPGLLKAEPTFASWVNHLLDVPLLFLVKDGLYCAPDGSTFRQFLERGIDGRFPTMADWELHITSVFPEARLKNFLEVRGADANPLPLALAVPALWKGLFYHPPSLQAASELANQFEPDELTLLFEDTAWHGLNTVHDGKSIRELAREVVRLARMGLTSLGEVAYLDVLNEALDNPKKKLRDVPPLAELWKMWEF